MINISVAIDGTTPDPEENVPFEAFDLRFSYISLLHKASVAASKKYIVGPNLYGGGTAKCVGEALAFLKPLVGPPYSPKIALFGYSRGAYSVLRVAQALGMAGLNVEFLGLIDTVKCTDSDTEDKIAQEIAKFVSGPDANQPAPKMKVTSQNWQDAYSKTMANADAQKKRNDAMTGVVNKSDCFQVPETVLFTMHARRNKAVNSRTIPMGHWDVRSNKTLKERIFMCTHSAMGGMPFRGDIPSAKVTRMAEWTECGKVGEFITDTAKTQKVIGGFTHPVIGQSTPPSSWFNSESIKEQYAEYCKYYGSDGLNLPGDAAIEQEARDERQGRQLVQQNRIR
jgi:hypothetical protein